MIRKYITVLFLWMCVYPRLAMGQERVETELRRADDLVMKGYESIFMDRNYTEAQRCYVEAIDIYKRLKGISDVKYLDAVYAMGDVCERQKDDAAALHWFRQYAESPAAVQTRVYTRIGALYVKMKNFSQAAAYYAECIALLEKNDTSGSSPLSDLYGELGDVQDVMGNYTEALAAYKKQAELVKKQNGEGYFYTIVLSKIGSMYQKSGENLRALECYNSCISVLTKSGELDKGGRMYSQLINNMGSSYSDLGDYARALEYYKSSLAINEKLYGQNHSEYAVALNNISLVYEKTGDYTLAEKYALQAIEIYANIYGKDHPEYANTCSNLGIIYDARGDYAKALQYCSRGVEIYSRVLGKNHPDYAVALNNLASVYLNKGDYKTALEYFNQAAEITRLALGERHPSYALSLNNIGEGYSKLGNYTEALGYFNRAAGINVAVLGKRHPVYALSLSNIGAVYREMGNYSEALRYYQEAAGIERAVLGEQNVSYAITLNNIGTVSQGLGNYSEALKYFNRVAGINRMVQGENHPDYANTLNNIGSVYDNLGNYSEALKYYSQAAEIHRKALGGNHPKYAMVLNNIGVAYNQSGNYSEALKYYTQAAEIKRTTLGEEHPDYAVSLYHIGVVYNACGLWPEAETCLRRARAIYESALLDNTSQYASILNNLAHACDGAGKQNEALKLYEQSAAVYHKIVGPQHPDYLLTCNNIGMTALFSGDFPRAVRQMESVFAGVRENMRTNFGYLTENERSVYWNKQQLILENTFALSGGEVNERVASLIYDASLLNKGLLLSTGLELERIIRESGDPQLLADYEILRGFRLRLMKLSELPAEEKKVESDSLEQLAMKAERSILSRSGVFGDYTRNTTINWKDVQQALKEHDVAVEFISYGFGTDTLYDALVLRRGWKAPRRIKLCSEADFRQHKVTVQNTAVYDTPAVLYDYTWGRLKEYISEQENVYFSLSGSLYQIAMEYLPTGAEQQRVCDKYHMFRLSSTRELALAGEKGAAHTAMLYGGLNYNTNINDMSSYASDYVRERGLSDRFGIADDVRLTTWGYLRGTRREVEEIKQALTKNQYTTAICMGDEGVEESFKALSGKKTGIIHIATHGFYFPLEISKTPGEDESLSRTGLVFAGANNAWMGQTGVPEDIDDGILTAKEISLLDLRETGLVVMSACQTGLGQVTGEGVFGLQRAFKKAGVKTLLMSLWSVNDEATQVMMTEFYKAFSAGKSKRSAFQAAQQTVKEQTFVVDGKERSGSEPYFWASFVMLD